MVDTFDYMFDHVKSKLSESEQSHYHSLIDEFENELASHSEISTLLYSWALRYDLKIISGAMTGEHVKELYKAYFK